jgi:two-component system, response regulator, stage 0 sporulation protein F
MLWNSEAEANDDQKMTQLSRRVVLVEDDLPLRDVLADEIRDLGFDVVELGDGVELLDYFRGAASSYQSTLPDIVVAEVDLPGCSGVEACRRLRSSGAQVPFILISPPGLAELHAAALKAGAECVIDKPFDIDVLADAVNHAARN